MYKALVAKFTQHEDLKERLLDTGDSLLVEHTKRDSYWGDGGDGGNDTKGKNVLGKLLVRVRNEIREGKIQSTDKKESAATTQGLDELLSEDAINKLIAESGIDIDKNPKRSKKKDIDFVLKRLES